jgi:hypothetical protein
MLKIDVEGMEERERVVERNLICWKLSILIVSVILFSLEYCFLACFYDSLGKIVI